MHVARSLLLLRLAVIACAAVFIAGCEGTEWEGMFDDIIGLTGSGSQGDTSDSDADTNGEEPEDEGDSNDADGESDSSDGDGAERSADGTRLIDYHGPVGSATQWPVSRTCTLEVQVYGTDNRPLPNARLHVNSYSAKWKEEVTLGATVTGYNQVPGTYSQYFGNCDEEGRFYYTKGFMLGGEDQQVGVIEVTYVSPSAFGLTSVVLDKKRVYFHVTDSRDGASITKYASLQE